LLALLVAPPATSAAAKLPAAAAYLVKAGDTVLWQKAIDKRLPPASLTKIMSALLVLEDYAPTRVVTVGAGAAAESGSHIGLRRGERIAEHDLLAAMLIQSANDACHALADALAGDEARFVARMNARAKTWGLHDTHFVNACGHDAAGHFSSTRDLAALAERAMLQPEFAAFVATETLTIATADGRSMELETHNALLGRYPGTVGVKTGYTAHAGKCLIAMVQREGRRVLLVMLNAPNRWWDASDVLDRAFAEYPDAR
jgi:serine-type D-Ala-D-Ala carboxypeptidase (penicillin-binding protein 5/6)